MSRSYDEDRRVKNVIDNYQETGAYKALNKLKIPAIVLVGGFLATIIAYSAATTYVKPKEVAVKSRNWAGGIEKKVYDGGQVYLNFNLTGPISYEVYPKGVLMLDYILPIAFSDMTSEQQEQIAKNREQLESQETPNTRGIDVLEVDAADGAKIHVDLTIMYRINQEKDPLAAWKVLTKIGAGKLYEDSYMIPRTTFWLKKALGELKSDDFYNSALREEKIQKALADINQELKEKDNGLIVDEILTRYFVYTSNYQKIIESKIEEEQKVLENQAKARAQEQDAIRRKVESEGKAQVPIKIREGDAEATKIMADAYKYKIGKEAAGDLQMKTKTADGQKLVSEALNVNGGENVLGLEGVKAFAGKTKIIIYNADNTQGPISIEDWIKNLQMQGGGSK